METSNAGQNIRRYLLGELAEADQRQLEESLFTSGELFEELLMVEDEIIDEYIAGRLTESERERFEQNFLSTPERLQKLRFAKVLKKHINAATLRESPQGATDESTPPGSFWKRWLAIFLHTRKPVLSFSLAAVLLFAIAGLWFLMHSQRTPQIAANRGPSPANANRSPSSSNVVYATLTPGLVRDTGEMRRVVVQASADAVELRLELASAEYESYRAMLLTDEGRNVFTGDSLKAQTADGEKVIAFNFPARLLSNGDYQVKLSGLNASGNPEDIGRYYFRVVKG